MRPLLASPVIAATSARIMFVHPRWLAISVRAVSVRAVPVMPAVVEAVVAAVVVSAAIVGPTAIVIIIAIAILLRVMLPGVMTLRGRRVLRILLLRVTRIRRRIAGPTLHSRRRAGIIRVVHLRCSAPRHTHSGNRRDYCQNRQLSHRSSKSALCTQPPNQQRPHLTETPPYLERSAPCGDTGEGGLNHQLLI